MATTFIKYKDNKGFYISEIFIQLAMHYINSEVKKILYSFSEKQEIVEDLQDNINGECNGYLVLYWKYILNGISDEQTMIKVLQNVNITLQQKGTSISIAELNAVETDDSDFKRFFSRKPFPTAELVKIIDALILILQGTWDFDNYDMKIDYGYYD